MQLTNPCKNCIVRARCSIPYNCPAQDNYRKFIRWIRGLALGFIATTICCHTLIFITIVSAKQIIGITVPLTAVAVTTFVYSIIIESKADDVISKHGRRK